MDCDVTAIMQEIGWGQHKLLTGLIDPERSMRRPVDAASPFRTSTARVWAETLLLFEQAVKHPSRMRRLRRAG